MSRPASYTDPELSRPMYPPLTVRGFLGVLAVYLGLLATLSQCSLCCLLAATR
ncbi:MAG: hypothetical protein ABEH86_12415 [Haloarcula sp.]